MIKKIKSKFTRYRLFVNPKLYRPSSKPFISGDTFRKMADHIFDETKTIKPFKVKTNDLVFVKSDLLNIYFENYHPEINNPYILISHNSDKNIEIEDIKYAQDKKIVHWFVQNLNVKSSDKISVLPIGLENLRYNKNGVVNDFLNISKITEQKNGVLCSFNENTNFTERGRLNEIINKIEFLENKKFDSTKEYLMSLNKSNFNICPSGNGLDTHRIWESLVFKVTPIVEKNKMTQNFFDMGVPLIILDDWTQLNNLSIDKLNKLNEININKDYSKYIKFDFWKNYINSKKIN